MRGTKQRLLSLLLVLVMVLGLLPGTAWAAGDQIGTVIFSVETKTINGGYIVEPMEEELYSEDTVYTILSRVAEEKNISVVGADAGYVTKIEGFGSYTDSDYGLESGWMAAINGDHNTWPFPELKDGDSVRFCYTYKTYGYDIDLIDLAEKLSEQVSAAEIKMEENNGNPFSEEEGYLYDSESQFNILASVYTEAELKLEEITRYDNYKAYLDHVNIYGAGSETETITSLLTKLEYALSGNQYISASEATISVENASGTFYVGQSYQLSATIQPENATVKQGTWAVVESTGKAEITQGGIITLKEAGWVTIQYWHPDASNGVLATKLIAIEEKPSEEKIIEEVLEGIASGYQNTYSNSKVIIDMAAYEERNPSTSYKTTSEAKQNYINFALFALTENNVTETTYSLAILGLQGIGVDPRALYPVNSNTAIDAVAGLNSVSHSASAWTAPYTLAAYNQGNYGTDAYEQALIADVLGAQRSDGRWTEHEESIQTTANMVTGLSFYYQTSEEVKSAVDRAIAYLSTQQQVNGTFGESSDADICANVVAALASVGINPDTDSRFVEGENSALDGLMTFALADNSGFGYRDNTTKNDYATEEGFRALIAAAQVMSTGTAYNIYDFSGNVVAPGRATGEGAVEKPSTPNTDHTISVYFTLKSDVDYWIPKTTVTVKEGSTVYHVFTQALDDAGITYTGAENGYVTSITKGSKTLAEFSKGENSGWLYKVNGDLPDVGLTSYVLEDGDNVLWYYTEDWTKDSAAGLKQPAISSDAKVTENTDGTYTVTLPEDSDGPVRVVIPNVKDGQIVVIVGKDGSEKVVKKSVVRNGSAYLLLEADATVRVVDRANAFGDVAANDWYAAAVDFVTGRGLFSGVTEDEFAPNMTLNRGMLVTVLYALEEPGKLTGKGNFYDVSPDVWYAQGVAWATQAGIVSGFGDGLFGPEEPITREQLALMLYQYAKTQGLSTGANTSLIGFRDQGDVSSWAREAVTWAVDAGIISGRPDGTLDPAGTATRAEAAVMLRQLVTLMTQA